MKFNGVLKYSNTLKFYVESSNGQRFKCNHYEQLISSIHEVSHNVLYELDDNGLACCIEIED